MKFSLNDENTRILDRNRIDKDTKTRYTFHGSSLRRYRETGKRRWNAFARMGAQRL
jgi:hypothetical protein